jgi:hypothetical protein
MARVTHSKAPLFVNVEWCVATEVQLLLDSFLLAGCKAALAAMD